MSEEEREGGREGVKEKGREGEKEGESCPNSEVVQDQRTAF